MTNTIATILAEYYRERGQKFGVSDHEVEKRVNSFLEGKQANEFIKKFSHFHPNLQEASILDVGCGPGRLVSPLYKMGYNIQGVEYDAALVKLGNQWVGEDAIQQGSAYELPYSNNSFDVVIAHDLLEHLPYPERALHEMVRVCKPEGHIYIVSPNRLYPREPHYSIFPFPSLAPKIFGTLYLKVLRRNPDFFQKDVWPITYWQLRKLIASYCPDYQCLEDHSVNWKFEINLVKAVARYFKRKFRIFGGMTFVAKKPLPEVDYKYSYDKEKYISKI